MIYTVYVANFQNKKKKKKYVDLSCWDFHTFKNIRKEEDHVKFIK